MIGLLLVPVVSAAAACVLAVVMGWGIGAAIGIYVLTGMVALLSLAAVRASCPERGQTLFSKDQ